MSSICKARKPQKCTTAASTSGYCELHFEAFKKKRQQIKKTNSERRKKRKLEEANIKPNEQEASENKEEKKEEAITNGDSERERLKTKIHELEVQSKAKDDKISEQAAQLKAKDDKNSEQAAQLKAYDEEATAQYKKDRATLDKYFNKDQAHAANQVNLNEIVQDMIDRYNGQRPGGRKSNEPIINKWKSMKPEERRHEAQKFYLTDFFQEYLKINKKYPPEEAEEDETPKEETKMLPVYFENSDDEDIDEIHKQFT